MDSKLFEVFEITDDRGCVYCYASGQIKESKHWVKYYCGNCNDMWLDEVIPNNVEIEILKAHLSHALILVEGSYSSLLGDTKKWIKEVEDLLVD